MGFHVISFSLEVLKRVKILLESQICVLVFRLKCSEKVEDFAGKSKNWTSISLENFPTSSEIWI